MLTHLIFKLGLCLLTFILMLVCWVAYYSTLHLDNQNANAFFPSFYILHSKFYISQSGIVTFVTTNSIITNKNTYFAES